LRHLIASCVAALAAALRRNDGSSCGYVAFIGSSASNSIRYFVTQTAPCLLLGCETGSIKPRSVFWDGTPADNPPSATIERKYRFLSSTMAVLRLTFTLDEMVNQHRLNREQRLAVKRQHILAATGWGPFISVKNARAGVSAFHPGIHRIGRTNWLQRQDSGMCFAVGAAADVRQCRKICTISLLRQIRASKRADAA
jgi:hypothetical protein